MPTPGAERDRQAGMAHDRAKAERDTGGGRGIGPSGTARGGFSRPGGQAASTRALNGPSIGGRIADMFGGVSGYATNPRKPGMGSVSVPNIPNASIGQILGGGITGLLGLHPAGKLATMGVNMATGTGNQYGPYGMVGKAIDSMFGGTPGKIEGQWGAGRFNDQGDPGQMRMATPATAPITGPTGTAGVTGGTAGGTGGSTPLGSLLGSGSWNGMYRPIQGPSNYGVTLPSWSYNYIR